MAEIGNNISIAKTHLEHGRLVAIPTETVYGLAANGLDAKAVARIFEAKDRPFFDPLILHIADSRKLVEIIREIPPTAKKLMKEFWPGALTLVLPKTGLVPDITSAGLTTVGVRMPNHPVTLDLLRSLSFPLAAPSANPFGYISPTTAAHVQEQLGMKIDYIIEGDSSSIGIESTIVGFENGIPTIYRKGGLPIEAIERVIGKVALREESSSAPTAPGMLQSHYAPTKPFLVGDIETLIRKNKNRTIAVLGYRHTYGLPGEILSKSGDLAEAAHHLFGAMRRLDSGQNDIILSEFLPEEGLGRAINDRLRRASYP